jgi:hypothetical protein
MSELQKIPQIADLINAYNKASRSKNQDISSFLNKTTQDAAIGRQKRDSPAQQGYGESFIPNTIMMLFQMCRLFPDCTGFTSPIAASFIHGNKEYVRLDDGNTDWDGIFPRCACSAPTQMNGRPIRIHKECLLDMLHSHTVALETHEYFLSLHRDVDDNYKWYKNATTPVAAIADVSSFCSINCQSELSLNKSNAVRLAFNGTIFRLLTGAGSFKRPTICECKTIVKLLKVKTVKIVWTLESVQKLKMTSTG